jgi:hypothetical protein
MFKNPALKLVVLAFSPLGLVSAVLADQPTPNADGPRAPKGYVLVEEHQWHKLADDPHRYFERARESFLKHDLKSTAADIRKAGVHLRVAAAHATARAKVELTQSEHALEQLAQRVETGSVRTVEELDVITSRALHSLADYQYVRAADAWRHREERLAGQYLRAATYNLENAAARTGDTLRNATAEVARDSRLMSGRLIEGTGFVVDEVGAGFEAFGRQIERVGKIVAPPATGSR